MISWEGGSERTGAGKSEVKEPRRGRAAAVDGRAAAVDGRAARSLSALALELGSLVRKLPQLLTGHVTWSTL